MSDSNNDLTIEALLPAHFPQPSCIRASSPSSHTREKSRSPKRNTRDSEISDAGHPRISQTKGSGSLPDLRTSSTTSPPKSSTKQSECEQETRDNVKTRATTPPAGVSPDATPRTVQRTQEEQLLDVLDHEGDTAHFRHHLQTEFIQELLDFYLAVDDWREQWLRSIVKLKTSKTRKVRIAAVELYATFIHTDSPRLINIPSQERAVIAEIIAPLWDVLDPAPVSPPNTATTSFFNKPATRSATAHKLPKISKHTAELERLEITEKLFNSAQATTFGMLLEPFSRFLEGPDYDKMQASRPLSERNTLGRRQLLKSRRPVKFEDIITDVDIQAAFESVLTKEYSEESLAFWIKLSGYTTSRQSELLDKANFILDHFITGERVYVSPELVAPVRTRVDSGKLDRLIFDHIRWEVEAILRTKFSDHLQYISTEVAKIRRSRS